MVQSCWISQNKYLTLFRFISSDWVQRKTNNQVKWHRLSPVEPCWTNTVGCVSFSFVDMVLIMEARNSQRLTTSLKYAIFVCFDRLNMIERCLSPSHVYTRRTTPQGLVFGGGSFGAESVFQLLAVTSCQGQIILSDCWFFCALAFLNSQISKVHQAPTLSASMAAAKTDIASKIFFLPASHSVQVHLGFDNWSSNAAIFHRRGEWQCYIWQPWPLGPRMTLFPQGNMM